MSLFEITKGVSSVSLENFETWQKSFLENLIFNMTKFKKKVDSLKSQKVEILFWKLSVKPFLQLKHQVVGKLFHYHPNVAEVELEP